MSSNPNNAVGTNAAYSGRTSVNAFNDGLASYSRGVLSGWDCSPSTGLKVQLGGTSTVRDVAVAVDNAGNRTTINNISGAPIEMTISAAPSTNSRIDAIVAYVDNPAEGVSTVADNPAACGMIVVKGTAAASPSVPNESTIRAAITADGASGATAYYAVLATVTIASGTTDIVAGNISAGSAAGIGAQNIDFTTLGNGLEWTTIGGSISGNSSWKDTGTKTVNAAGLYFIKLWFSGGPSGTTKHQGKARVLVDNVEVLDATSWSVDNYAGNNFSDEFTAGLARIDAGSTVKCQAQLQNWTGTINAKCWITRIG